MRKKIIKAWVVALPLLMLSFNWYTYADDDFDCTSLDMDTMEEIKEKLDSGEDLTSDEEEIMENAQSCGWPQWGQWGGMWGESEGWEMWEWGPQWGGMWGESEDWEMWEGGPQWGGMWGESEEWSPTFEWDEEDDTVDDDTGLSTQMQAAIDRAIDSLESSYSGLDDDDQVEKYETIIEKLEDKLETILDSDDIDDEKQELLENIIEEMITQLEELIEELED